MKFDANTFLSNNYKQVKQVRTIGDVKWHFERDGVPLHVCVWHKKIRYFHHFIITEVTKDNITIVHKINKEWYKLIFSAASSLDVITEIKELTTPIGSYNKEFFNFKAGVYIIGDYNKDEKLKALKRIKSTIGTKEIYSIKDSNCEHFSNWVFTGKARSYQAEHFSGKAIGCDSLLHLLVKSPGDIIKKGGENLIKEGFKKSVVSKAPTFTVNKL